jgi:tetratricopeptide (TPR) repeat protein
MTPSAQLSPQNPWPGLAAFTEEDHEFFFGRAQVTAELVSLVQRGPVVVLYGRSGLGKTSLVQAGLFPQLREAGFLPVRLRLDHAENAPSFAQQIKNGLAAEMDRANLAAPRPAVEETLWEYFHRRDLEIWGPRNRLLTPVVALDQFEEVFTLGERDERATARVAALVDELEALLEHRPPARVRDALEAEPDAALRYDLQREGVKLLLILREDFLPHLDTWRARIPSLLPHRFRLERMTGAQALDVVLRSGRQLLDADVGRRIVAFVSSSQRTRQGDRDVEGREVEPALLSLVCYELNRRRVDRGQEQISADLLSDEAGGIIRGFYEDAFAGVDPRVREWVEDELLTASGYRDRAALEDALSTGLSRDALDHLVDRRLLHREEREGVVWIELTHDLLTDPASESRAAREKHRQAEQVKAAATRARMYRRQARRGWLTAGVCAVLLVVSIWALVYSWLKRHEANESRREARISAEEAKSNAARAQENLKRAQEHLDMLAAARQRMLQDAEQRATEHVAWLRRERSQPSTGALGRTQAILSELERFAREHDASPALEQRYAEALGLAAEIFEQRARFDKALQAAQGAIATSATLKGSGAPTDVARVVEAQGHYVTGAALLATGQFQKAAERFDLARRLEPPAAPGADAWERERLYLLATLGLGQIEAHRYARAAARKHFEDVLGRATRSRGRDPAEVRERRFAEASARLGLSSTLRWIDQKAAWRHLAPATQQLQEVADSHREDRRWRRVLAKFACAQATLEIELGQLTEAARLLDDADDGESLSVLDEENLDWRLGSAEASLVRGHLYLERDRTKDAEMALAEAQKRAGALLVTQPSWLSARQVAARATHLLGQVALRAHRASKSQPTDQLDAAARHFAHAQRLVEDGARLSPHSNPLRRDRAVAIAWQGSVHVARSEHGRAVARFTEALRSLDRLDPDAQHDPVVLDNKVWLHQQLADVWEKEKKYEHALLEYERALAIRTRLTRSSGVGSDAVAGLALVSEQMARVHLQNKAPSRALQALALGSAALDSAIGADPENPRLLRARARILRLTAEAWRDHGDVEQALGSLEGGIATVQAAWARTPSDAQLWEEMRGLNTLAGALRELAAGQDARQDRRDPASLTERLRTLAEKSKPERLLYPEKRRITNGILVLDEHEGWSIAPIVRGAWRTLSTSEQLAEVRRATEVWATVGVAPTQVRRVRAVRLPFYRRTFLYEAEIARSDGSDGIVGYIRHTADVVLDGKSSGIHGLNAKAPVILERVDQVDAYVRFFVGALEGGDDRHGNRSRFAIVENAGELRWDGTTGPAERIALGRLLARSIRPLTVEPEDSGAWRVSGTVTYFDGIFYAIFRVSRNGAIEMKADAAIAQNVPIAREVFVKGMRVEAPLASSAEGLRERTRRLTGLKLWHEAAQLQQRLVSLLGKDPSSDTAPRRDLAGAYLNLSWYQLLARDFTGAMASTQAGHEVKSGDADVELMLDGNRAHALLFLGRIPEALQLYAAHRGKTLAPPARTPWETLVRDDLSQMEREGLSHEAMARIRSELRVESR